MLSLCERTFGLELEFADVKSPTLPVGYYIDKDETIQNSDGSKSKGGSGRGVEICTRPLRFVLSDLRELRKLIRDVYDAGGKGLFFDGALYIGDLGIEDLILITEYIYNNGADIYRVFRVPLRLRNEVMAPLIREAEIKAVRKAKSVEEFVRIFANSSNKRFKRPVVSPTLSLIKNGVLEFRCFNASKDFREVLETIAFMYKFVDKALSKDGALIDSYVNLEKIPSEVPPMLMCGEDGFSGRNVTVIGKKTLSVIENGDVVYDGRGSVFVYGDNKVITPSYTVFILEKMLKDGLNVEYTDELEFLNHSEYGSCAVMKLMFAMDLAKVLSMRKKLNEEQVEKEFLARVSCFSTFVERNEKFIDAVKDRVASGVLVFGGVERAVRENKGTIVVISGDYKKPNMSEYFVAKHSNIELEVSNVGSSELFRGLDIKLISRYKHHPLKKILIDGELSVYQESGNSVGLNKTYKDVSYGFEIFRGKITSDSKIEVVQVRQGVLSFYRDLHIKKVARNGRNMFKCKMSFMVLIDSKVIGFFGFNYKGNVIHLATDFVVNHDVYRSAKLVLFCTQMKSVSREFSRKMGEVYESIITEVYTTQKVSSKYRGAYKLVERKDGVLVYESKVGIYANENEVLAEYLRRFA